METFHKLFGSVQGYLPLLTRPEHIVHFFRDVHHVYPITKDALAKRTQEYQRWVDAFARNHRIAIEWADDKALKAKGLKREDYVRPYGTSMERRKRFGPYFILKSLEQGPKFGVHVPKYPTDDPNYRIVTRQRSRYTHYYFYIRDEVLGPMIMCVGSFLPFQTTYYLNGHAFIAGELQREGVRFRKDDNAFLGTADLPALQAATGSVQRSFGNAWTTGPWCSDPSFLKRIARPSICVATTRSTRSSTVAISSFAAISRSIRSSNARANWGSFG